jgi:hypothetical protein
VGRKFVEGLVFGAGFAIAFLVVQVLAPSLLLPLVSTPRERAISYSAPQHDADRMEGESGPSFHELPVEEQIKRASVIALARFEPANDGRRKAVIAEILKQDPGTTFHYSVGDEYPDGSFYPLGRRRAR